LLETHSLIASDVVVSRGPLDPAAPEVLLRGCSLSVVATSCSVSTDQTTCMPRFFHLEPRRRKGRQDVSGAVNGGTIALWIRSIVSCSALRSTKESGCDSSRPVT